MIENGQGGNEENSGGDHDDGLGRLLDDMDLAGAMLEHTGGEPEAAEELFHALHDDVDDGEADDDSDDD